MRGQSLVFLVVIFLLAACVLPVGAREGIRTPAVSPEPSGPERATVRGTVVDVMLSARVLVLDTDGGPVNLALVEGTRILGASGEPIALRDILPGHVVEAHGRMTQPGTMIPEVVRVMQE